MNFPLAPDQASTFAATHDFVFYLTTALTVIFTLLVLALVLTFAIRYRSTARVDRSSPPHENMMLEIGMTVLPLILGLLMFYIGAKQFVIERTPPRDAMEIYVVGKQWMWHFQHSNGVRENNTLHVPLGKPVKLTMISQDVLHALYIPEFRVQYHVVPGRYSQVWFQATKAGTYHLFCAMYCGTQHSEMGGTVVVQEQADFAKWLAAGGNDSKAMTMEQQGLEVYNRLACANCHVQSDTERAPSLVGLYGKIRDTQKSGKLVADEAYIRQQVLTPENNLLKGYIGTMPTYKGQVTEDELLQLIAYVKSNANTGLKAEASEPQRGVAPANDFKGKVPVGAVGALATQEPPKTAPPRKGQLAVGALSSQSEGTNR